MKKLVFILSLLFYQITTYAVEANYADSLLFEIKKTKVGEQYHLLDSIAEKNIYLDSELSIIFSDYHYSLSLENADSSEQVNALINNALALNTLRKIDLALEKLDLALTLIPGIDKTVQAELLRTVGVYHQLNRDFAKAEEFYLNSLYTAELSPVDSLSASRVLKSMASLYEWLRDVKTSRKFSRKALQYAPSTKHVLLSQIYQNLAATYDLDSSEYDSSLFFNYQALKYAYLGGSQLMLMRLSVNMLNKALELDDKKTIFGSIQILDSIGVTESFKNSHPAYVYAKGLTLYYKGNYETSLAALYDFIYSDKYDLDLRFKTLAAHTMRLCYRKLGKLDEALEMGDTLIELKNRLYEVDIYEKITELQTKYDSEKKDLLVKKKEIELSALESKSQFRIWLLLLISIILILMLSLLWLFYNRQKLKSKNLTLENKIAQQKLESSESEKSLLRTKLEANEKELAAITLSMIRKNDQIDEIKKQIVNTKDYDRISQLKIKMKENAIADTEWNNFNLYFKNIHPEFYQKFKEVCPNCTVSELRLASLIKLKMTNREIANILGVNVRSVDQNKYRLKKKVVIKDQKNFTEFIEEL